MIIFPKGPAQPTKAEKNQVEEIHIPAMRKTYCVKVCTFVVATKLRGIAGASRVASEPVCGGWPLLPSGFSDRILLCSSSSYLTDLEEDQN